ncbi:hypothetical protein [Streptomyces griseofuscus]|uniref:hypothetical protein n=1 Tax=Streptomyces griseofuscus TaxID=146922 RepID=UPI0034533ADD
MTRQQVREYEHGWRSPDPASVVRMVRALGVESAQTARPGAVRLADLRHWAGLTGEQGRLGALAGGPAGGR